MSIEEIIEGLKRMAEQSNELGMQTEDTKQAITIIRDAYATVRAAIALLKTNPEAQPNEPLTLEELREMDGEPVYLYFGAPKTGEWVLMSVSNDRIFFRHKNGVPAPIEMALECGGNLYRRPLKEAADGPA